MNESPTTREDPRTEEVLPLLGDALAGDADAVRALVRRLMPVVNARARRALARRGCGPQELADLVQEVWVALLDGRGKLLRRYDPNRGATLEGYVGMVSEREIGNRLRSRDAKKRGGRVVTVKEIDLHDLPARNGGPEHTVAAADLAARLGEHLMNALPPRGRLVFRYSFTDDLPPARIAAILGVDVQVIYNWQHRIRQVSREFLEASRNHPSTIGSGQGTVGARRGASNEP